MDTTVMLCTDGSGLALDALRQGLELLVPATRTVVVSVMAPFDPSLMTGTGFAGGVMTPDERDEAMEKEASEAQLAIDEVVSGLGLVDAETIVRVGDAGHEICELAASLPASVVVIGTHGHSGVRRAMMGSTSDYVVRNAVCPVLVQGAG
jgi:nucleotide-binding universal stress UspA family protein